MGNRTGASANHPSRDGAEYEEDIVLLASKPEDDDDDRTDEDGSDGVMVHPRHRGPSPTAPEQQQDRTPRTPNRVRFDLRPTTVDDAAAGAGGGGAYHHSRDSLDDDAGDDDDDDEPLNPDALYGDGRGRGRQQEQQRLLTDIEAPSVALANSPWTGDDDDDEEGGGMHEWAEAERRRPKSGLSSAFMNMANSIIGAGIIGQPYAFRQAGLLSGILLLVGLTFVVDWTICLIVINSKLSGANSFQGTVEHCFGRPGLIAISVAQWAFAFGGMVAFGIIVGDSIPHVLTAVWPGLRDIPVLGLLADRRAAIVVFVLGISYPLTLYRDIAKVMLSNPEQRKWSPLHVQSANYLDSQLAKASTLALVSMTIIVFTVLIQGVMVPSELRGTIDTSHLFINDGIFQAVGVISFGMPGKPLPPRCKNTDCVV